MLLITPEFKLGAVHSYLPTSIVRYKFSEKCSEHRLQTRAFFLRPTRHLSRLKTLL